jgi:hypothetical protein
MRFPSIDYQTHPAYSPYESSIKYDNSFVEQGVRAVDSASAAFYEIAEPLEHDAASALACIRLAMDGILYHAKKQGIPAIAEEWLRVCAQWTIADFNYEFVRRIFSSREHRPVVLSPSHALQLSNMRSQGMYVTDIKKIAYDAIRQLATKEMKVLKDRAFKNPNERAVVNVAYNSPLWRAIKRGVKQAGILDVLSEFKGNEMTMLGAGLEYSYPGQGWYQNLYSDVGLSGGPFQYLHYDEGDCLPKSMIYVTPVDEDCGPTRAIPTSNTWEISECRIRMHRALDRIIGDRYSQLDERGGYRVLARRPELRRVFMELPAAFRGSSHFGDDIMSNTDLAATLQALEIPYVSKGAQTMVFDGPHLLHRGSLVRSGERLALQVVYRNRNEARIRSELSRETYIREQFRLWRKYARKFVMEHA